jgi:hypothetical protein
METKPGAGRQILGAAPPAADAGIKLPRVIDVRSLTDAERSELGRASALSSPVGFLFQLAGGLVSLVQGLLVFALPIVLGAALLGAIGWSDVRVVLAWLVAGWVLLRGAAFAHVPYAALISRRNHSAHVQVHDDGRERVVGWRDRPFLGVVAIPVVLVAWVVASLAFHWVMP